MVERPLYRGVCDIKSTGDAMVCAPKYPLKEPCVKDFDSVAERHGPVKYVTLVSDRERIDKPLQTHIRRTTFNLSV